MQRYRVTGPPTSRSAVQNSKTALRFVRLLFIPPGFQEPRINRL
jgi:hypothetical protein